MEITAKKLESVNTTDTSTTLIVVGAALVIIGAVVKSLGS